MAKPTALLVTAVHWPATSRLALALLDAGFEVAAVTPRDHTLVRLNVLCKCYVFNRYGQRLRSLGRATARAISELMPSIVIPCDDAAVRLLQALYAETSSNGTMSDTAALLRKSLGDPAGFSITASKCAFMAFAESIGLAVPRTDVIRGRAHLRQLPLGSIPRVIKLDGMSGGEGVCILRTEESWREMIDHMSDARSLLRLFKPVVQKGTLLPLRLALGALEAPILLQEFIPGAQANCTVFAWQGEIHACHSARVVKTLSETGPATVSWIGHFREIEEIAALIVRRLGFSGFCGFDFILRAQDGDPILIEMNSRPTQTCHLALEPGSSLCAALFGAVTGADFAAPKPVDRERLVALFPLELWRDPESPYLHDAYHDVPWEAPLLISAYRRPPTHWAERFNLLLKAMSMPVMRSREVSAPIDSTAALRQE